MTEEIIHIGDLKPDPANRRKHNPRNIGMIEQSYNEVGAGRSIVIDENYQLIAGEGSIDGAALAGIEKVQVVHTDGETIIAVMRDNLTPEQKRKMAMYDNRTAELADWDVDQIVADLDEGLDFDGLFYEDELAAIVAGLDFMPVGADEQPRLDERSPITCPHCGEEFVPR